MLVATLLWSMAGVVTLHLEAARGFEATFWRSFFNALALVVLLGRAARRRAWRRPCARRKTLWLSGLCWSVMFTAFMVAMTMTTVANVLVTMAMAPLLTALIARFVLGNRLPGRTWAAVAVAGVGIAWMYAQRARRSPTRAISSARVALARAARRRDQLVRDPAQPRRGGADLLPAVLLGALLSALLTLPLSLPFSGSPHDIGCWLCSASPNWRSRA